MKGMSTDDLKGMRKDNLKDTSSENLKEVVTWQESTFLLPACDGHPGIERLVSPSH